MKHNSFARFVIILALNLGLIEALAELPRDLRVTDVTPRILDNNYKAFLDSQRVSSHIANFAEAKSSKDSRDFDRLAIHLINRERLKIILENAKREKNSKLDPTRIQEIRRAITADELRFPMPKEMEAAVSKQR